MAENNIKIKVRNKILEIVEEIKYFGIIIDKNLHFAIHIDYIKKIGIRLGVRDE